MVWYVDIEESGHFCFRCVLTINIVNESGCPASISGGFIYTRNKFVWKHIFNEFRSCEVFFNTKQVYVIVSEQVTCFVFVFYFVQYTTQFLFCPVYHSWQRCVNAFQLSPCISAALVYVIQNTNALQWRNNRSMASQITSLTTVHSTVYSGADEGKHQSSVSLAFVWGIHRWPVNSPHKWPVTRKRFPFNDVIMVALTIVAQADSRGLLILLAPGSFEGTF